MMINMIYHLKYLNIKKLNLDTTKKKDLIVPLAMNASLGLAVVVGREHIYRVDSHSLRRGADEES